MDIRFGPIVLEIPSEAQRNSQYEIRATPQEGIHTHTAQTSQ